MRWATQRERKATVRCLRDDGRQALTEPNAPLTKMAQAKDTLDLTNRLGIDGEQQALYHQLSEKIQQAPPGSAAPTEAAQAHERAMVLVPARTFLMGSTDGEYNGRG